MLVLQIDDEHPPQASAPAQVASETDELFEREREEHVDADTLERVLEALLQRYPRVPVAALKSDGISTAIPASIALRENPVLQARSGLDLVVHEDRLRLLATWDRVLAGGAARCLARLAAKPGETVAVYGLDLRERHGVVITMFVPAEPSAQISCEPVEAAEPAPRLATIAKDERSFIVETDEALTKILGWSAEEMVGRRSIDFIHPDDHALAIDNWMEMLATPQLGRRVRLRHLHRDGGWVWFEVTNHNLLDRPQQRVVSEIVDISEEMAAHEALRAREQLLDRLAGAIPLGLFQIDAGREIVYTNDRLHEILGVGRVAGVEQQLASVVADDRPRLERALDEVLGEGRPIDIELELCLPARADRRFCAVNLRALSLEDGTISGAIACVSDVTDSTRMREELKRRATFDELTGCLNRASIMRALQADIDERGPDGERAVMFVDLDRFKEINDSHGHATGDELLRVLSARLREAVRDGDLVGRIGGDEFLVMCPDVGGSASAMTLAGRVAAALQEEVSLELARAQLRVSIGVAFSQGQQADSDALVALADDAMYRSKRELGGTPVSA